MVRGVTIANMPESSRNLSSIQALLPEEFAESGDVKSKGMDDLIQKIYLTGKRPRFIGSFHTNECRHFSWYGQLIRALSA